MKSSRRLVSGTLVISARTVLAATDVVGRINTSRDKDDARCILLAEFFGPAAHGPLQGLLCVRAITPVIKLLWRTCCYRTWGSLALVRGPRGGFLWTSCGLRCRKDAGLSAPWP